MKILHFYPKSDPMLTRHVSILVDGMRHSAEVQAADSLSDFKAQLQEMRPDIVHCHGCWQYAISKASAMAHKRGKRIVLSPHGQLEPWMIKDKSAINGDAKSPTDVVGKTVFLQRRAVERAYAIIAFGKMERQHLERLGWNPRIEVVHNAIITNSITPKDMCSQTFAIYQKVLDSNVLEQMDDRDKLLMAQIIKAGITGDARWTETPTNDHPDWRRILIYAEHQNIRNYVDYGINILGLQPEAIDTTGIPSYFPESYKRPVSIKTLIGDFKGDETDYLIRMLRQILTAPILLHLIELHRELRRDSVDDDKLKETLEEKHLTADAARLMQILAEQTQLDEGYMPLDPVDDRKTQQIRNIIANHLKI
jgi:hypothetical protein